MVSVEVADTDMLDLALLLTRLQALPHLHASLGYLICAGGNVGEVVTTRTSFEVGWQPWEMYQYKVNHFELKILQTLINHVDDHLEFMEFWRKFGSDEQILSFVHFQNC